MAEKPSFFRRLSQSFTKKAKQEVILLDDYQYDSDELKHNCHSEPDMQVDLDPLFEYNKCHKLQFLDKKCEDKIYRFEPIQLEKSTNHDFMVKHECDEKENLSVQTKIETRFHKQMERWVQVESFTSEEESKKLNDYLTQA